MLTTHIALGHQAAVAGYVRQTFLQFPGISINRDGNFFTLRFKMCHLDLYMNVIFNSSPMQRPVRGAVACIVTRRVDRAALLVAGVSLGWTYFR